MHAASCQLHLDKLKTVLTLTQIVCPDRENASCIQSIDKAISLSGMGGVSRAQAADETEWCCSSRTLQASPRPSAASTMALLQSVMESMSLCLLTLQRELPLLSVKDHHVLAAGTQRLQQSDL